jgi:glutathione S-transferase
MSFTLHYHPIASFAMKVVIGLYEVGFEFDKKTINLGDPKEREEFLELTPIGKLPVLRDDDRGRVYLETSVILEAMAGDRLIPRDRDLALATRYHDRFFDSYVAEPMSKIVTDKIRPPGRGDSFGVEEARKQLATAYDIIERRIGDRYAVGEPFTLADCAASPALWYANKVQPFGDRPRLTAYYERLMARPAFQRVLEEAKPLMHLFPG